jgi:hypothetical protein
MDNGMVLTVRTGRDDAMSIFRSWIEKGTLLRFDVELVRCAATMRARIRALSPEQVELIADDTRGELIVPLSADLEFGIGDFRVRIPAIVITSSRPL